MKIMKRTIMILLFVVGFALLVSESESVKAFLISKGLAAACAYVFYLLWKIWNMDDDPFVRKMKEDK